jgi:hypothetical protein
MGHTLALEVVVMAVALLRVFGAVPDFTETQPGV